MMWGMWFIPVILVFVVFYMFKDNSMFKGGQDESPLDVLKKRYAKGEITKEQFDEIKKDL